MRCFVSFQKLNMCASLLLASLIVSSSMHVSAQTPGRAASTNKPQAANANKPQAARTAASGKSPVTLYGQVDEVNFALRAAGLTTDGTRLPAVITNVRAGSPAFYAGVQQEDRLLAGSINDRKLHLTISRNGKIYALSVATAPVSFVKQHASTDQPPGVLSVKDGKPPVEKEKKPLERLSQYQVVIVVDASGSMNDDLTSENTSKWKWCSANISDFARQMKPHWMGAGITLLTFNANYTKERNCSPERVEDVFRSTQPRGGTDMGSPLEDVLSEYLSSSRSKPLVVVVLTDGIPTMGPRVEGIIENATQKMRSQDEIRMTFLEVGDEYNGASFLKLLDDYLVADGAKYDIVDSLTFDQLKKLGLVGAIIHAIDATPKSLPAGEDLRSQLANLKQQIEQARAARQGNSVRSNQKRGL